MRSDAHPCLWHNLGKARSDSEDFPGAVVACTKAIDLGYPSQVNRGFVFEQIEQPEAAKKDYLDALAESPNDVVAMINLGTLELSLGNTGEALRWLTAAAGLDRKANWQLAEPWLR
jgi:tetratricopeptide (TPR) repeat protein